MTSQIATPIAAATTRNRHEYAVATRRPRGTDPETSVDTTAAVAERVDERAAGLSSEPLITPV